jgi:hypothetical protein
VKRVVSVSLGSSKGDKRVRTTFLGKEFEVERRSAAGMEAAMALIRELDGHVDAIGLGGIDRYLYAGSRRYTIRDGERLARCATKSPVVDGSGVKNTLERETIHWLSAERVIDFDHSRVLLLCAVDRFGMAEALDRIAAEIVYGDLLFALELPIPLHTHRAVQRVGQLLLPIVTNLPFEWFYPTGEKQDKVTPKHEKWFRWADVIAGDSKYLFRYMPSPEKRALSGKTILTQTLTPDNVETLRRSGAARLITYTPEIEGRTFATNVFEGILVALAGGGRDGLRPDEYREWLHRMNWQPTIRHLSEEPLTAATA